MIQSLEKVRKEAGNRSIADKIVKRLHDLEKAVESNLGRWAWELLQNAKDSIADDKGRNLSVQIELDHNSVYFRHNGGYFTEKDITGLISQVSSKEVEEGEQTSRTGRFGTGFLTTHLLSREVDIEGVIKAEDNKFYRFKFLLDRRGTTTNQLMPRIDKSWDDFGKSMMVLENPNENHLNTSFCYHLKTDEQREIAEIGESQFLMLIPFVLAFIPKIEKVEVINKKKGTGTYFLSKEKLNELPVLNISKVESGKEFDIFILIHSNERVSIAAELESSERGFLVKNMSKVPKLFCNFPLIGTEEFYFPMLINSFFFNPQTERDGIWLKGDNDNEVRENRNILQDAVELYKELILVIARENLFDLYNLAENRIPTPEIRNLDRDWYESYIQKTLRQFIIDAKLVETQMPENNKSSIRELYFPSKSIKKRSERQRFWQFISDLSPKSVCKEEHLHLWCDLSWNEWSLIGYEELVGKVAAHGSIVELCKNLDKSELETLQWLNSFNKFILENPENFYLSNKWPTIPNKNGILKERDSLFIDKIEDNELLEILRLLGKDWKEVLLHDLVDFGEYHTKEKKNIAVEITEELKIHNKTDDPSRKKAITLLLEWFENKPELGSNLLPEIYGERAELFMNTIEDKDSLYQIMRSGEDLSKLVEFIKTVKDYSNVVEDMKRVGELDAILLEFSADNISELRDILISANESTKNKKVKITKDVLLGLGVASVRELNNVLKSKEIADSFVHTSEPSAEMFEYVQALIKRSKENVRKHLESLREYDCSDWEELATTVIGGVEKGGQSIEIVIRPSDSGEVIIYYSSEKDTLDNPSAELWIDNGIHNPQRLSLGKILKNTGINRIPVTEDGHHK